MIFFFDADSWDVVESVSEQMFDAVMSAGANCACESTTGIMMRGDWSMNVYG